MDTIAGVANPSETQVDDPSLRTITLGVPEDIAIEAPVVNYHHPTLDSPLLNYLLKPYKAQRKVMTRQYPRRQ